MNHSARPQTAKKDLARGNLLERNPGEESREESGRGIWKRKGPGRRASDRKEGLGIGASDPKGPERGASGDEVCLRPDLVGWKTTYVPYLQGKLLDEFWIRFISFKSSYGGYSTPPFQSLLRPSLKLL